MELKLEVIFLVLSLVSVTFVQTATIPINYPINFRARRDVLSGQVSTNPAGGNDALLKAQIGAGTPDHNVIGTAFAAGNTDRGPVATGAGVAYNLNSHGVSATKTHIPGGADITDYNARVNLFNGEAGKFDANVFKSNIQLPGGFDLTKTGGNLDFNSPGGHGAKFEISRIPELGTTYGATGKLNLWQSMDQATKLDLTGTASKTYGGLFDGRQNFGGGLGLTHTFG